MAQDDQQLLEGGLITESTRQELVSEEVEGSEEPVLDNQAVEDSEEDTEYQLALEREASGLNREVETIAEAGREYKHPSYFKYLILGFLAAASDGLDLLTFTGFGIIIAFFTSLFLNSSIFLISWFTNTKSGQAQNYIQNTQNRIKELGEQLQGLERNVAHTARIARRVMGKKGTGKAITKGLGQAGKFLKNAGLIVEVIPLLDFGFLPLTLLSVGLSYWDERTTYKNAAQASEEASDTISTIST